MAGGVSAFGITVVVGAMLGRLLPALLAAATFVLFATLLIQQGNERGEAFPEYADPDTGQLRAGVTEMTRFVPIEIYPEVAARYVLLHLFVGLTALTLAFAVVERRSP